MATKETITITDQSAHILLTWSVSGQTAQIPKRNLALIYKPDKNNIYKVYLTWPGGDMPYAYDSQQLKASEVVGVTTDAELFALLKGYASSDPSAIAVSWYGQDIINDGDAHAGEWKALQVLSTTTFATLTDNGANPSTGQTGVALPAGSYLSANGIYTLVDGDAAALYIMIRADNDDGFTTTTSTTTT